MFPPRNFLCGFSFSERERGPVGMIFGRADCGHFEEFLVPLLPFVEYASFQIAREIPFGLKTKFPHRCKDCIVRRPLHCVDEAFSFCVVPAMMRNIM